MIPYNYIHTNKYIDLNFIQRSDDDPFFKRAQIELPHIIWLHMHKSFF